MRLSTQQSMACWELIFISISTTAPWTASTQTFRNHSLDLPGNVYIPHPWYSLLGSSIHYYCKPEKNTAKNTLENCILCMEELHLNR
jgi:hypothetical protein